MQEVADFLRPPTFYVPRKKGSLDNRLSSGVHA
jgi:hypothetical protein